MRLNHTEIGTILAALRYYQTKGLGNPDLRPAAIHDIAVGHSSIMSSLDDDGIDELCERLNYAD